MKENMIDIGDEVFIQIKEAEWYGRLIDWDYYGITFEVSKGRGEGNIVKSSEKYIITKIVEKKKDEEGDVHSDN